MQLFFQSFYIHASSHPPEIIFQPDYFLHIQGIKFIVDITDYFFQQSLDNGQTWGKKFSVMSQIKEKANATGNYTMKNFFVGSGKIVMSRKYKKQGAQYKRIYCVLWGYGKHGTESLTRTNWVVYSDDFGKTWDILGGTYAAKGSCDEPKCEELPDGNIVLSSRESGCRWFNTFTYSDKENGTGTWGTAKASNTVTGGLSFGGNAKKFRPRFSFLVKMYFYY